MAFNVGAALTSAGEIAPALTAAKQAEVERKDTLARLAQESTSRDLANQRSQFELGQEKQKWIPLGITQSIGGVRKQAVLTPDKGIQWIESDDPVAERQRVFKQLSQDPEVGKTLSSLAPDDQAQYFLTGKFPTRPSADTLARADFAADPNRKPDETFEEWKARKASSGRAAGTPPKTLKPSDYMRIAGKPASERTQEEQQFMAGYDEWLKGQIKLAGSRGAAYNLTRPVQVRDPNDPNNVVYMPAGIAEKLGATTSQSLDFQIQRASQTALARAFTSGTPAKNIASINTLKGHLAMLQRAADALNNQDIQLFNRLSQMWATATGSPAPTNFESMKAAVTGELGTTLKGTGATDKEIQILQGTINQAESPDQLSGAITTYQNQMDSRLQALKAQYAAGKQGLPAFGDIAPQLAKPLKGSSDKKVDDFLKSF